MLIAVRACSWPGTAKAALQQSCGRTWEFLLGESKAPSPYAAVCTWPALPVRVRSVLQPRALGLVGDDVALCVCGYFQNAVSRRQSPRAAATLTPSAMRPRRSASRPGWTPSRYSPLPRWTAALSYPAPLPPSSPSSPTPQEVSMHPPFTCCSKNMLLGAQERLLALKEEAELRCAFAVSQTLQGMSRCFPLRVLGNLVRR